MKRLSVAFLVFSIVVLGCSSSDRKKDTKTLTIFAAASLTDAFTEIGRNFEATHDNVEVRFNFGGSSQLAAQINNGAPGDVFASANISQMTVVESADKVEGTSAIFATNSLVLIVSVASGADISSLVALRNDDIRFITAVDGVPIREYTNTALASLSGDALYGADFMEAVFDNLVSEETNVRQVVLKVSLGEADAAIVYASDVTPDIADSLTVIQIPTKYNIIAEYPIAVLSDAKEKTLAQQFVDFVLEADDTLTKWGLLPVE